MRTGGELCDLALPNRASSASANQPRFSVIIPASGRRSLRRTLTCLRREDEGDIEVLVVSDGHQPLSERIARKVAESWDGVRYVEAQRTSSWGNAQRMEGIRRARGRYLLFMDDDDYHRRGAFAHIRAAARANPDRVTLFRMKWRGEILWRHPSVEVTNGGTPQILVPNLPGRVGSWLTNDHRWSDFDFISECIALQGSQCGIQRSSRLLTLFDGQTSRAG